MDRQSDRDLWLEQAMVRWEVPLLRTCYLLLKDTALAEDALQETFIKAWRSYGNYRGDASEKTWLMRIAVNTCRDMLRGDVPARGPKGPHEDLPEAAVVIQWPDDTLTRAILALPDGLRSVVILRYYQGFSIQETASLLKLSRRSVHYRLEKAEHLLKDHLEGWYDA